MSENPRHYGTRLYNMSAKASRLAFIHTAEDLEGECIYSENKDRAVREALEDTRKGEPVRKETSELMKHLETRLLEFGGTEMIIPEQEEDLDSLLVYGQLWPGKNAILKKGQPNQCHRNSSQLWYINRTLCPDLRICTGYALSEDGIWRQHSWVIDRAPRSVRIYETTTKRVAYYGYVMSSEECLEFYEANY